MQRKRRKTLKFALFFVFEERNPFIPSSISVEEKAILKNVNGHLAKTGMNCSVQMFRLNKKQEVPFIKLEKWPVFKDSLTLILSFLFI